MKIKETIILPVMLYDGDCGFCQYWVEKWEKLTGDRVEYKPYQKALESFPQLTKEECKKTIHVVVPDGKIYAGAQAVLKALEIGGRFKCLYWCYSHLPLFAPAAEAFYRLVSRHRPFLSRFIKSKSCPIR